MAPSWETPPRARPRPPVRAKGCYDLSPETAACASSLGRVEWLKRGATHTFMIVSFIALLFLMIRGLQYPDPAALSTPWYTNPGFVVGIPAVPFIMPFLLGVVLLRRAGEEQSQEGPNPAMQPREESRN